MSSPELGAKAFVDALNSGDYEQVVRVLGQPNIDAAVAECEAQKKKPEPQKPKGGDPWAGFAQTIYEMQMDLRKQDCAKIPADLRAFVTWVGKGHSIELSGPDRSPIGMGKNTDSGKLEDGRQFAAFKLEPSDWDHDKYHLDQLVVVREEDGSWVPTFGASASIHVANYVFALPSCAKGFAAQQLQDALK